MLFEVASIPSLVSRLQSLLTLEVLSTYDFILKITLFKSTIVNAGTGEHELTVKSLSVTLFTKEQVVSVQLQLMGAGLSKRPIE